MEVIKDIHAYLVQINKSICEYEEEIDYLESVLLNSHGVMNEVIDELSRTKQDLAHLRSQQSQLIKQMEELKNSK